MDRNSIEKRVAFEHPLAVTITGIDGTWRRDCQLAEISENAAKLIIDGGLHGLNLQEFFLLLTPKGGVAFRRCELIRVHGHEVEVRFLTKTGARGKRSKQREEAAKRAEQHQNNSAPHLGPQRLRY